jgi:hypothetical protein
MAHRTMTVVLLVSVLTACAPTLLPSVAVPVASEPETPEVPVPPDALINDSAGMPATFCWGGACVDSFYPPVLRVEAPLVPLPAEIVDSPADAHVESVRAADYDLEDPFQDVTFNGNELGVLPPGIDVLLVHVRWPSGEDATYAWRLVP